MDNLWAYITMGGLNVVWAIIMWFMVTEPRIMDKRESRRLGKKSLFGKVWSLSKLVYKACKQDSAFFVGLLCLTVARNTSFMQQVTYQSWVSTYPGWETAAEGKKVW